MIWNGWSKQQPRYRHHSPLHPCEAAKRRQGTTPGGHSLRSRKLTELPRSSREPTAHARAELVLTSCVLEAKLPCYDAVLIEMKQADVIEAEKSRSMVQN